MLPVQVVTTATEGTAEQPWNCTCVVLAPCCCWVWSPRTSTGWDLGWESQMMPAAVTAAEPHQGPGTGDTAPLEGLWGTFVSLFPGGYDATIPHTGRNCLMAGHCHHRCPQQWMSPSLSLFSHPAEQSATHGTPGLLSLSSGGCEATIPRCARALFAPPPAGATVPAPAPRSVRRGRERRSGEPGPPAAPPPSLPASRAEPSRAMGPASPRPAQPCWAPRAAAMMRSASLRRARAPRRRRGGRARRAA